MNQVQTSIFVADTIKAIGLYQSAFGLEIVRQLPGQNQPSYTVLNRNKELFCSVVEETQPQKAGYNPVQLQVSFGKEKELKRAFEILKGQGTVIMEPSVLPYSPLAAAITDEFGVNWFLLLDPSMN